MNPTRSPLENEASFRLMFNNNPLPMWIHDTRSLRFLAVNNAALRHYGHTTEEFMGSTVDLLRPPGYVAEGPKPEEIPAGLSVTVTEKHQCKNGRIINVELTWSRIEFTQRDAIFVMAHDITDRKRAEQQIREQANLLNLAHDAIIVRDFDDRIRFWNKGAERLYGWTAAEAIGQIANDLLNWQTEAFQSAQKELLRHGEWNGQLSQNTKSARQIVVSSRWTLVANEDGSPKSILLINSDITEQKQLEQQFLRTQRLESIGTLASGIAHDLNNILTPISMSIGLLRQSITDAGRLKLLNTVEVSAQRGADIVRQVLTFARGVEGERVLLQTRHLIGELVKILAQTFPRNINIKSRFPKELWTVQGDATQLHQVLLNLCVNARDAMPDGGILIVSAENVTLDANCKSVNAEARPGPYIILGVSDTGSGIPPEVIEKIWDPFFTTKEPGKGTGLGLSTVVGIVQNHGGFVNLETAAGKGTQFSVYIPAKLDQNEIFEAESRDIVPAGTGEIILVVDDEPAIREAAISTLQANGYHVFSAEDGTDALALYFQRRSEIALILTDIAMELMDGVALVRALRKLQPDVKVIASTGQGQAEQKHALKALGVTSFLDKPYTADRMLRTIYDALHPEPPEGLEVQPAARLAASPAETRPEPEPEPEPATP